MIYLLFDNPGDKGKVSFISQLIHGEVKEIYSPKADLTVKKIFSNHPDLLISLLNALLPLSEDQQIQSIEYLPAFNDAELRAYDKFWDMVSSERTLMGGSYDEGVKKGEDRKAIQIAQKMKAKGMDVDTIMEMTGLDAEEIENLT